MWCVYMYTSYIRQVAQECCSCRYGGSVTNLILECHLFRLLSPGEEERSDQHSHLEQSHGCKPSLLPILLQSLNLLYTVGLP